MNYKNVILAVSLIFMLNNGKGIAETKPNVLMIAVDDLNHWTGYLGRNPQARTPNIDRLARMGLSFTRSYCAAPVCNPSRTALLSGMRPSSTGVYDNNNDWRTVIDPSKTLPTAFRKAGYRTYGAGKLYHGSFDRHSEWDDYLEDEGRDPIPKGNTGVGGIAFAPLDCDDKDLREWKVVQYGIDKLQEKSDRPFFISVGLHKPHLQWNVPRKSYTMFPADQIQLPPYREDDLNDIPPAGIAMAKPQGDHKAILDSGRWKEAIQGYLAAIAYCDAMIGRLLDALEKSPEAKNTMIVFWGDHGWHLGEKQHWRKFALWEEATRAPLLWVAPGLTTPGTTCERTVDFMTIFPTLVDLCGLPAPSHLEGKSIRELLKNPQAEWKMPALTTFRFKNHAVRTEDYRYIRYANGDEELYNEKKDPFEWNNLAKDPAFASVKKDLAEFLPKQNTADIGNARAEEKKATKAKKQARTN
ncbi:MAG: sulfatase [Isosphaeraceae bacterium]